MWVLSVETSRVIDFLAQCSLAVRAVWGEGDHQILFLFCGFQLSCQCIELWLVTDSCQLPRCMLPSIVVSRCLIGRVTKF